MQSCAVSVASTGHAAGVAILYVMLPRWALRHHKILFSPGWHSVRLWKLNLKVWIPSSETKPSQFSFADKLIESNIIIH